MEKIILECEITDLVEFDKAWKKQITLDYKITGNDKM